MKYILTLITLVSILVSRPARANNDWDHIGTSFAVQLVLYGVARMAGIGQHTPYHYNTNPYFDYEVNRPRTEPVIFSGVLTFLGTFAYSYAKTLRPANQPLPAREILMNGIGQSVGIGSIYLFKF